MSAPRPSASSAQATNAEGSPRLPRPLAGAGAALAVAAVLVAGFAAPASGAKAPKPPRTTTTTAAPTTTTTTAAPTTTTTAAPTTTTTAAPTTTTTAAPTTTTTAAPTTTTTAAPTVPVPIEELPVVPPIDDDLPISPDLATNSMLIGTRAVALTDTTSMPAMNAWQGKTNATVQTYIRSDWGPTKYLQQLDAIWSQGSVPTVSYDLQVMNAQVTAGAIDTNLNLIAAATKTWLSGPDGVYKTADDRRLYFRPAWEMNGNWYRWSPCYAGGGTVDEYKAMWRYLYAKFAAEGIENTRMAWIYSVNSGDWNLNCTAEAMYPGDAYVDWTGIDGYTFTSSKSPYGVFYAMFARLKALAPTKPVSVNEWGADSLTSVGKGQWISNYFLVAHGLGIQMSVSFNADKEREWAVFGGATGDEVFAWNGLTYNAWSTYRVAVGDSRVIGASSSNPRLLTNAQFLGRAET